MPTYLQHDGVNDYWTAPAWNPSALGFTFRIKYIRQETQSQSLLSGQYQNGVYIRDGGSGVIFCWYNNQNIVDLDVSSWGTDEEHDIAIRVNADGSCDTIVDGTTTLGVRAAGYFTGVGTTAQQTWVGQTRIGNNYPLMGCLEVEFIDDTTPTNSRFWDCTNTTSGSSVPETTGNGTDGTLVNFPTDDSQWISLGGEDALLADDLESASEVSSPTLGQVHALTADNLESVSSVSSPTLTEVIAAGPFNFDPDNISISSATELISLTSSTVVLSLESDTELFTLR